MTGIAIDEVGKKYGRLAVLSRAGSRNKKAVWSCRCECGAEVAVLGRNLRSGATQSCGCLQKEGAAKRMRARALPFGEAAFNALIIDLRCSAKRRGYIWNLTNAQIKQLTSRSCHYCGVEPSQKRSNSYQYNGAYLYNGLDRINSEKGYTIDNIVPCCKTCNYAKRTMTQDKFLAWISRVYAHSILKEKDETLP